MKKIILATAILTLAFAPSAFAAQSAQSVAISGSQATGAITNPSATSSLKQTFEGSHTSIPAPMPSVITPAIPSSEIFGPSGMPTVVAGIQMSEWYASYCKPVATREHRLVAIHLSGESGKTEITFVPHQDYFMTGSVNSSVDTTWEYKKIRTKKGYVKKVVWNTQTMSDISVDRVSALPGMGSYVPLGVVTIQVTDKDGGVPLSVVRSDLRSFAFDHLKGWSKVYTLTTGGAVGAVATRSSGGIGFSLLGQGVNYALNGATGGLLGGGVSLGSGSAGADARVGSTYVLFAPANGSADTVFIRPYTLDRAYHHQKK